MSIASEITRLQGVKSDILTAIGNKGVTVPSGSALDDCPGLIGQISGGSVPIPQTFVDKTIFGKVYKCVEIAPNVFFPIRNLEYTDENIQLVSSGFDKSQSQCALYNYDQQYSGNGYIYTWSAVTHLRSILPSNIREITATDVQNVLSYIKSKLKTWLGDDSYSLGDLIATFCAKNPSKYSNALGLLDLGFYKTGSYNSGQFRDIDSYCGFGSNNYGAFISVQTDNISAKYVATDNGWPTGAYCYSVRFIVDEN